MFDDTDFDASCVVCGRVEGCEGHDGSHPVLVAHNAGDHSACADSGLCDVVEYGVAR